ncbi:MAG TPA: PIG-L family deacetylase [Candidatus Hydrogenedentes bacterium]|nr:PIG-L family deacetylase [Candidatus Hydrogenedentota bacterium]HQH50887.1 PIG-L family deacetylase [Candidatus Hydrogenedentota bacterium]HQM48665.1 PIG-L family deacetylase [Candidatus Hydrogenedentota bacterium]
MNVVIFGAHPDDCEAYAGGTAVKWVRAGNRVLFVSLTNGDAGHHDMGGGALARRRRKESALSAQRGGVETLILDHHDGELMPTLDVRHEVIRIIRSHDAGIVVSHHPADYHPDHRYTSTLVQDASFMVTVPNCCPGVEALRGNPCFFYLMHARPSTLALTPDIAVAIDDVMDVKYDMLDAMESQMYEWLPWLEGQLDQVPSSREARKEWLRANWDRTFTKHAEINRDLLAKWYGPDQARETRYVETFETCPYGRQPSDQELRKLFPFFPEMAR